MTNSLSHPSYNKPIIRTERRWDVYYELYIDVFFLVNFMMDYLLLRLTGKMLRCQTSHGRVCAGALLGACLTCVVTVVPGIPGAVKFILFHGGVSVLMLKTGLKIPWDKTIFRAYLFLYISAFLTGGVMGFFRQYLRAGSLFFALAVLGYSVSMGAFRLVEYLAERKVGRCQVRLWKGDRSCEVEALVDTGNRLRDSLTGKPVSIIAKETAAYLDPGYIHEERYITYHSVGKKEGKMPLLALDGMCVKRNPEIWVELPLAAVCEEEITKDGYKMLVNPDLL